MLICMCMLTKRTNILFSQRMWQELAALAKKQETSTANLIRNAVAIKYFSAGANERVSRAYESILKNRKHTAGKIDYKALINDGRRV